MQSLRMSLSPIKRLQLHDCISVKEKQSNCKRTALIIYLAIGIVKPDGKNKNDI